MSDNPNETGEEKKKRSPGEEIEVAGHQLIDRIQEIVRQGNVRRLIIRSSDDRVLLETSLTVGAGLGGALAFVGGLPLAIIAAIAAAAARVKIEVVREVGDGDVVSGEVTHKEDSPVDAAPADNGKKKVEIPINDDE